MNRGVWGMTVGRRSLLGCALGAAGVALIGVTKGKSNTEPFRTPTAARAVGARYLAHYPGERQAGLLREALFANGLPTDPAALRRHIAALCRRDFAAGETVVVDGWILARSEARACALVSLGAYPA